MAKKVLGRDPFSKDPEVAVIPSTLKKERKKKPSEKASAPVAKKRASEKTSAPAAKKTARKKSVAAKKSRPIVTAAEDRPKKGTPIAAAAKDRPEKPKPIAVTAEDRPKKPKPVAAAAKPEETTEIQPYFDDSEAPSWSWIEKMWIDLAMRNRSERVDDFGYDQRYLKYWMPFFEFLYYKWWRVEAKGLRHIPNHGRAILVANHSGTLPFDAAMIMTSIKLNHKERRFARPLVEDRVYHFPFVGPFVSRVGGIRACQENALRLLEQNQMIVVFPEGIKGTGKLFGHRYKLQRFGRGGFIKLALRSGSPIIPVSVIGAEETFPLLWKIHWVARNIGLPYFPITPTFPILGPLGALPLPSKWIIRFGKPIPLEKYTPDDANDRLLVNRLSENVRLTIQRMVNEGLKERKSAFIG